MKTSMLPLLLLGILGLIPQLASGQDWGTVKGRFVVKGAVKDLEALTVTKDNGFCGDKLPDPALQVDKEGNLKDVALWLVVDRNEEAPEPHPSYAAKMKEAVVIDNQKCLYVPQVALICTGQPVEFKNSDPIPHNFSTSTFTNRQINNLVPAGGMLPHKFPDEESGPRPASCTIHPWMKSYMVIRESPYMAVSADDGTFTIENLPVGKHKFQVWHAQAGNAKGLKQGGKKVADRKGIIEIEVKAGENDLGDFEIDAKDLK